MDINEIRNENYQKIDNMIEDKNNKFVQNTQEWIEYEGVTFLQSELNKYQGIFDATGITTKDKGVSYDGSIIVKNNGSSKGDEWVASIDVQVKSKMVDKLKKGNSKFSIEVTHLKNYVKHPLGVLLFVVFIEKETLEKKIFYRNLLPLDLQRIFDEINEEQKYKTIDIFPITTNQKEKLKNVCLQFIKSGKLQINKRIVVLNEKTKPLELIVHDFSDEINELILDKIYMYAKFHEDEGFIPAILPENTKIQKIQEIEMPIKVDDTIYYESFKKIINEDCIQLQFGNGIIYDINNKTLKYNIYGTLDEIINDYKFLVAFFKKYPNNKKDIIPKLEKSLEVMVDFKEGLKTLNIEINNSFNGFDIKDFANMDYFNKLIKEDKDVIDKIPESQLFSVKIQGKSIIIFMRKDKGTFEIYNFYNFISRKFVIWNENKEKNYERISPYVIIRDEKIEDILNYNIDAVEETIDNYENNELNSTYMNYMGLDMIEYYDKFKDDKFLNIALKLFEKLIYFDKDNINYYLNKMQIIKRKRAFEESEIETLYNIKNKENDNAILYGISILLENKSDIKFYYNKFDNDTKEKFDKYPISKLKVD